MDVQYTSAHYDRILYDLSGNGSVGPEDLALKLVRLSPWSYGVLGTYAIDVSAEDTITLMGGYSYRDPAFSSDNNRGLLRQSKQLTASIAWATMDRKLEFSIYGKNLFNWAEWGLETPLPVGTHSPLQKGRVIGAEMRFNF